MSFLYIGRMEKTVKWYDLNRKSLKQKEIARLNMEKKKLKTLEVIFKTKAFAN